MHQITWNCNKADLCFAKLAKTNLSRNLGEREREFKLFKAMEDITHQDSTITSCFQNLHTTSASQVRQHEDTHDISPSSASTAQSDSLPPKTPVKMERENILTIPNLLCLRYVCINLKKFKHCSRNKFKLFCIKTLQTVSCHLPTSYLKSVKRPCSVLAG